jgi:hypothetical protein
MFFVARPTDVSFDFFSTAAQVIPLIFVVLAVEFRGQGFAFVPRELIGESADTQSPTSLKEAGTAAYSMVLALVLALGEGAALHVLAGDDTWGGWKWLVGSCLVAGGVGVIAHVLILQYNVVARNEHFARLRPVTNVLAWAAGFVVGALGAVALIWVQNQLL